MTAQSDSLPIIVTDATCDLPRAIFQKYPIRVVSQKILFGENAYDGTQLSLEQFYELLGKTDVHPETRPVAEADFIQTFTELRATNAPILAILISAGLSESVQFAQRAAHQLSDQSITVWDSKMTSGGLGLQVLTAARAVAAGYTVDQILTLLEESYRQQNMYFCLNDLDHLYRGGRIGRVSYHVAQALRLKPIITVSKEGATAGTYITGAERPHTMQAAVNALVRHVVNSVELRSQLRAIIHYSGSTAIELVQQIEEQLRERFDCVYLEIVPVGPVVAVHTGPGGLGIAYMVGDWVV